MIQIFTQVCDMLFFVSFLNFFFQAYTLLLLIRILSSWVPESREYRIIQLIGFCTDPYLDLFRKMIPPLGMFDLSPVVAFLCLGVIQNILTNLIIQMAR